MLWRLSGGRSEDQDEPTRVLTILKRRRGFEEPPGAWFLSRSTSFCLAHNRNSLIFSPEACGRFINTCADSRGPAWRFTVRVLGPVLVACIVFTFLRIHGYDFTVSSGGGSFMAPWRNHDAGECKPVKIKHHKSDYKSQIIKTENQEPLEVQPPDSQQNHKSTKSMKSQQISHTGAPSSGGPPVGLKFWRMEQIGSDCSCDWNQRVDLSGTKCWFGGWWDAATLCLKNSQRGSTSLPEFIFTQFSKQEMKSWTFF